MAKQQLMATLERALTQSNQYVMAVKLQSTRATDAKDVAVLLRASDALAKSLPALEAAIKAFDTHAKTWDNESRWKRAKNLAIPKLTATRNRMKQSSTGAKQSLADAQKLVKRTRLIAAKLQLS